MQELLTLDQAATQLKVTPQWLAKAARKGTVPSRKIGRYRRFTDADLDDYLERARQGKDPWKRSPQSESRLKRGRRSA
ncbi:excisionase family DNA binding protein [Haloactinopolyspora alba]|uniref:Excisionase family DNA binding protein n=1 Tax=Haloactinopolyspora alba TaxID=648780 RepID=A0A2P8DHL2_9ACTN|nr:helix-turn-helix domain-containing protein [Haloactinopolyspora alba]PSK96669.1 excisionase family DNA binding protein [Haloactinopolyspora alba]